MEEKLSLAGLTSSEITETLGISPAFRGKQIYEWIAKGVSDFDSMTNLDQGTRNLLKEKACIHSSSITEIQKDKDGTIKLQITLSDGCAVETVLLTDRSGRKTACVSCQAGCAMGCAFCQTGQLGLKRNLTAGEIVEEFIFLEREAGKLDNIVFMGMGEPMQNLDAILKTVSILTDKKGRDLSSRRITLSTCGIISGIRKLADTKDSKIRLAISLTTADPDLRAQLMPVTKGNSLPELRDAISYYIEKTGKRVTLEAALLKGRNTGTKSAENMIQFAKGLDVYINLIPWNAVPGLPFETPGQKECNDFMVALQAAGLNVSLRTRRGTSIAGACGQLGRTTAAIQKQNG